MSAVLKPAMPAVRPMREEDLHAVLAIEQDAYEYPWSSAIFDDCLRVGYCCWVLEWEGRMIGYSIMSVGAGESHLLNLCIHPGSQRRGFGQGLLEHMLDLARKHRAAIMFLEVRPTNLGAIRLYERAGFTKVGTRRAYYPAPGGREDALILSMTL
jgi:ribosomal-protein-alanine N-acetyltransferase